MTTTIPPVHGPARGALADRDRRILAQARELCEITGIGQIRHRADTADSAVALAHVFGEARWLLAELAAITERLAGITGAQADPDGRPSG